MSDVSAVKETLLQRMEMFHEVEGEPEPKKTRKTALDILLGPEEDTLPDASPKGEVERYFTEPTLPRKESPLAWWKDNASRFLYLSQVAHSILNIHATSTPSEWAFSAAGLIVSPMRACLKPKNVDAFGLFKQELQALVTCKTITCYSSNRNDFCLNFLAVESFYRTI